MTLLLYVAVTATVLFAVDRLVTPLTRATAIVLFVLPLLFTGRALLTGGVYGPVDLLYQFEPLASMRAEHGIGAPRNVVATDLITQVIPWRKAVQWSLQNGQWPLWNPFILTGDILAAAAQPAPYSPLTLLASLLSVVQGLTFSAALTFFVAGVSAFLFAREIGCRDTVALFAAAAWMYSSAISFFGLWPIGLAWTLLPLILFAVRRRGPWLLTGAFVLLLLAGHPETALHVVTIAAAYALFEHWGSWKALFGAALCGIGALLLCAISLLPLLEAAPQTSEHEYRERVWASRPRGIPAEQSVARLLTNVFPHLHVRKWTFGSIPTETAAVGSIVLALAMFALVRVRRREVLFFAGVLLFGLIAQAEQRWFETLMQRLPLFDIALNARFVFAAAFALVMLAALGLESVSWRPLAVVCAVLLVVLGAGIALIRVPGAQMPWAQYKVFAELGGLIALPFLARRHAAVIGLLLLQRVVEEGRAYPTVDADAAYPPVPIFKTIDRTQPFRIVALGNEFPPGTAALYELEDVRGYQALTLLRHADTYELWSKEQPVWFNRVDDLTRPFLSFLNVRYAIATGEETPEGWREVASQPGSRLLENERFVPRAFVPRHVRLGTAESQEIAEMRGETDFTDRAWIRASTETHERANGPGTVAIARDGAQFQLDVTMERGGWVVVSESAWKGWRAYIDGRRVQMQVANHAFLSVYVPDGRHGVRLVYLPQSFVIGRTISFGTLLLIAIALVWRRYRD